jgi:UTP--glucose-1-phosphate uridylyltransferase
MLRRKEKHGLADDLENFYRKLESASVVWVNQPEPKGFGHAVYLAKPFIGDDEFLVHAGDTYIISEQNEHFQRLMEAHRDLEADATLIVQHVDDPRMYGVVRVERIDERTYRVNEAIEKPEVPPTKLAIMPIYVFRPTIFNALGKIEPGKGGEIQLTDAIQMLITQGRKVNAIELKPTEVRLDIGTPEMYWKAVRLSYEYGTKQTP